MDPVAIDSVAFDFIVEQWPGHALMNEGVQDYLHEMALANNPPSGTFYDPEKDGSRLPSMGVHEHWNNATDKQYSRNLGTDEGIELLYIHILAGDFDSDNDVDDLNLYNFIVAYSTNAYPDTDVNRDGLINPDDIAGFAEEFGLTQIERKSKVPQLQGVQG